MANALKLIAKERKRLGIVSSPENLDTSEEFTDVVGDRSPLMKVQPSSRTRKANKNKFQDDNDENRVSAVSQNHGRERRSGTKNKKKKKKRREENDDRDKHFRYLKNTIASERKRSKNAEKMVEELRVQLTNELNMAGEVEQILETKENEIIERSREIERLNSECRSLQRRIVSLEEERDKRPPRQVYESLRLKSKRNMELEKLMSDLIKRSKDKESEAQSKICELERQIERYESSKSSQAAEFDNHLQSMDKMMRKNVKEERTRADKAEMAMKAALRAKISTTRVRREDEETTRKLRHALQEKTRELEVMRCEKEEAAAAAAAAAGEGAIHNDDVRRGGECLVRNAAADDDDDVIGRARQMAIQAKIVTCDALTERVGQLNEEVSNLKDALCEERCRVAKLHDDAREERKATTTFRKSAEEAEARVNEKTKELHVARNEIEKYRADLLAKENDMARSSECLTRANFRISAGDAAKVALERTSRQLRQYVRVLEKRFCDSKGALELLQGRLDRNNQDELDRRREIRRLESSAAAFDETIRKSRQKNETLRNERDHEHTESAKLRRLNATLRAELRELAKLHANAKESAAKEKASRAVMDVVVEQSKKKIGELKSKLESDRTTVTSLQHDRDACVSKTLETKAKQIESLRSESKTYKEKFEQLQEELDRKSRYVAQLEVAVKTATDTLKKMMAKRAPATVSAVATRGRRMEMVGSGMATSTRHLYRTSMLVYRPSRSRVVVLCLFGALVAFSWTTISANNVSFLPDHIFEIPVDYDANVIGFHVGKLDALGFHGDKYLIRGVDAIAPEVIQFVETGTHAASTLHFM
eukprot:g5406.t1